MLLFAAVLCAVCVLGCCVVRFPSCPPCAVLGRAVLVRLRCAICLVCAVSGAWCCRPLLSVVRFPAVLRCVVVRRAASSCGPLCCAAVSSAGGRMPCCAVRVSVRPCSPLFPCSSVLCSVALCCRALLWCPVLLPCSFSCVCWFSYLKNHRNLLKNKKSKDQNFFDF